MSHFGLKITLFRFAQQSSPGHLLWWNSIKGHKDALHICSSPGCYSSIIATK